MKIIRITIYLSLITTIFIYPLHAMERRTEELTATEKYCQARVLCNKAELTNQSGDQEKLVKIFEQEPSADQLVDGPEVEHVFSEHKLLRAVWNIKDQKIFVFKNDEKAACLKIIDLKQEGIKLKSFSFDHSDNQLVVCDESGTKSYFPIEGVPLPTDPYIGSVCTIQ